MKTQLGRPRGLDLYLSEPFVAPSGRDVTLAQIILFATCWQPSLGRFSGAGRSNAKLKVQGSNPGWGGQGFAAEALQV